LWVKFFQQTFKEELSSDNVIRASQSGMATYTYPGSEDGDPAKRKEARETENLHQTTRQANGVWCTFGVALLALAVSVIGACFIFSELDAAWITADQTKRQADATVAQAENMDRPWIKTLLFEHPRIDFTGPGMPDKFDIPNEKIEVFLNGKTLIKNVGRTTAIHVRIFAKLVVKRWESGWIDFPQEQILACSEVKDIAGYETTLFPEDPSDEGTFVKGVYLSQDNISMAGEVKYIAPAIVGYIDYMFSSSQKHHETRFVYEMIRSDDRSRIFTLGQDVDETGITLIRDARYDYAD
jgi:hypothetical protein